MALTEDRLRPEAAPEPTAKPTTDPAADRARLRALRAERLARLRAAPKTAASGPGLAEAAATESVASGPAVPPDAPAGAVLPGPRPAPADLADPDALVAFLRALTGDGELDAPPPAGRPAAEVLRFERPAAPAPEMDAAPAAAAEATTEAVPETGPEAVRGAAPAAPPAPACDLDRLPGAGPGLVWALRCAGIDRLADLATLAEADLAARLGPLGRLVPAAAWIATARAATG
jgi:predicted flap endonuclease-1-like 5' DNA nuclease